jgi:VIT1/CCC1 family predicted Fe2+/Mn2+ transporter
VPAANPSGAVYGVIVIGALLAAESGRHESYLDTFASAAIAAALYWVAHSYAGVLGRRLSTGERLTAAALLDSLAHDWALIRGASIPLLALAIAALAGAAQETAVTAAVWSSIVSLAVFELIAGLRSGASRGELALEVGVGVAMGLAILALKIVLH